MKSISTVRPLAACALFASLLAGCSSYSSDKSPSDSGQGATGAQGQTSSGAAPTRSDCAEFHQMESRHTPSTQQELVDPYLRGMTPEERERHMAMMREKCGTRGSPTESKY